MALPRISIVIIEPARTEKTTGPTLGASVVFFWFWPGEVSWDSTGVHGIHFGFSPIGRLHGR